MNTPHYIIAAVALSLFVIPLAPAYGATFLPVSEEVASLRSEAKGDVYAASNSVVITAPVAGDIFAAGDTVDISGSSDASIFAVGRTLAITGAVKDDARIAGSIISIGSEIAHDLFAAGSSILITKDSHVHGDAYLGGETVTISGTIHGNVQVAASKVVVTDGAVVMGDITAHGSAPVIQEGATVSGKITTIASEDLENTAREGFTLGAFIASTLSASALALLLLFGAPVLVAKTNALITKSPVQSGLIGFLWMVLCVPATLLLMISSIGLYAGIFILAVTFPVSILAFGMVVVTTGSMVYRLIFKNEGTLWHHALLGAVIVSLVALLKFIGFVLLTVAFLVAFGAVLKALWNMVQGK